MHRELLWCAMELYLEWQTPHSCSWSPATIVAQRITCLYSCSTASTGCLCMAFIWSNPFHFTISVRFVVVYVPESFYNNLLMLSGLFAPPGLVGAWSWSFGIQNCLGIITHLSFPTAAPWYGDQYGYPLPPGNYSMPGSSAGLIRVDKVLGTHLVRYASLTVCRADQQ